MRPILLIISLLIINARSPAQNTGGNPTLVSFNAQRVGNFIQLSWTIRSGFSCASVYVTHSSDSSVYNSIYQYPGICGATTQDESYSFTHESPVVGWNYYKMDLGSYGASGIIQFYFVPYSEELTITTDGNNRHEVYFSNPGNSFFVMEIFDVSGKVLYRSGEAAGDQAEIPQIITGDMILFVRITIEDGTTYTGKFYNTD